MKVILITCWLTLLSAFLVPAPCLGKTLYILLPCNKVLVIEYARNERNLIQQLLRNGNLTRLVAIPAEAIQEDRVRHYSLGRFMRYWGEGTLEAGWSPLPSPQHWNQNALQPIAQAVPNLAAPMPSYADICINQLLHDQCNYPHCYLTHLTPGEIKQVKDSPQFYKMDGSINTEICICYYDGECEDPNCNKLHINFDSQKDLHDHPE
ncbi:hypothetical protein [Endozoicomonas arenosclerae]|uniref:hypothetical protein n=1 Tax=Endozoicomonas arenosclerae TaxID=1633495 RepID=UPI0007827DC6|nr:hypothetical protein [Endozoicomonas arenosclerae]